MKAENRLKKRKQFNWIFKNGTVCHSKDIALVFVVSKGKNFKVGFSVTKKVGKAVVRNKIKRRLKNIVVKYQNQILKNRALIFVAKPTSVETTFDDLKIQVEQLLKKADLLKECKEES